MKTITSKKRERGEETNELVDWELCEGRQNHRKRMERDKEREREQKEKKETGREGTKK